MYIRPLAAADLPAAAQVLNATLQRMQLAPVSHTAALAGIAAALRRPHALGLAACDQAGTLQAYVVGDQLLDTLWDRTGWIRPAGWGATADGLPHSAELYAALGAEWVRRGIFTHIVQTSGREHLAHWFELGFGCEQIHGVQALTHAAAPPPAPGLGVRRATPADRAQVEQFADLLWREQGLAPGWAVQLPELIEPNRQAWGALLDEADVTINLGLLDGAVVAMQGFWPSELRTQDNPLLPPGCARMSVAVVAPEARQRGVMRYLTAANAAAAAAQGFGWWETDWRSANLAAARTWPRLGFAPSFYRLVRRLDARIAWLPDVV